MEGILSPLPWTVDRVCLRVPNLGSQPCGHFFDSLPHHNQFRWRDGAVDSFHAIGNIESLAAIAQCWLFFGLLSAFLEKDIRREDFVRDGWIDCNGDAAHVYFRRWRLRISKLSTSQKHKKRQKSMLSSILLQKIAMLLRN